jgi:phosphoglycerate dehydrogenase-like enzyme
VSGVVAGTPRSCRSTPGAHRDLLAASGLDVRLPSGTGIQDESEMVELDRGCDALIVGLDPVTQSVLDAGPLRAVVKYGTGLDNTDVDAAHSRGVKVASTPIANTTTVAELTIGLILCLARHIVWTTTCSRPDPWVRRTGFELAGRCLGVVGYGAVGREVAKLARVFGMSVVAHDP